jgi:hypothetical protein
LTEIVCNENENVVIISTETSLPFSENIVARKTIVYETLIDPAVIRISAENLKDELFTRYVFFKALPNEVNVVSVDRFYEPFIKVSGRYSINYYRRRVLTINVENNVSELVFPFARCQATQLADSFGKMRNAVALEGEEKLRNETSASLALDASGRDTSLKQLPSAPSERNPGEVLSQFCVKEVPRELEVSVLRNRIQKRPADASWVANEVFEVSERLVVYAPRYRAVFKHAKSGKERVAEFDGVTGKLIRTSDSRNTIGSA